MEMPSYILPVVHSNKRRARWHDYRSVSLYMLTYTALPHRPSLGSVELINKEPTIVHTALGKKILEEIDKIPIFHPRIDLYTRVVMPDHIHFIIYVKERLDRQLGMELAGFSKACNDAYRDILRDDAYRDHILHDEAYRDIIRGGNELQLPDCDKSDLLFDEGFNDRIIMHPNQLDTCRRYIEDNPRRLYIKKLYPDLFRRYNHLQIDNRHYAAYGNIFLLRDFERMQVVIHRADSSETRLLNKKRWLQCASNGGVLVSPFISRDEKEIRNLAIDAGANLIIIRNEGFEERFKPSGLEFELCSEGRLLLLAPWPDKLRRSVVTRAEALEMNALAAKIADLPADADISLK